MYIASRGWPIFKNSTSRGMAAAMDVVAGTVITDVLAPENSRQLFIAGCVLLKIRVQLVGRGLLGLLYLRYRIVEPGQIHPPALSPGLSQDLLSSLPERAKSPGKAAHE